MAPESIGTAVWSAKVGGCHTNIAKRRGASTLGDGVASRGCTTLGGGSTLGGRVAIAGQAGVRLVGEAAGGSLSEVSAVVTRCGERLGLGVGRAIGWLGRSGARGAGNGPVVAMVKTEPRRARSSMALLLRLLDRAPCSIAASFPAAAMTVSSGMTARLEMYLCL